MKNYFKNKRNSRTALIVVLLLVIALGIIAILDFTDRTSLLFDKDSRASDDRAAKTTSTLPSAQPNYSGADANPNKLGNVVSKDKGEANVSDTGGQASGGTGEPRSSTSGEITVYLPLNNAIVGAGQELSGTSKLSRVSYRIIDNVSGVIGSGDLSVTDGKFSGAINYSTSASEGRIDVFGVREDLTEFSNVEVPVRFK